MTGCIGTVNSKLGINTPMSLINVSNFLTYLQITLSLLLFLGSIYLFIRVKKLQVKEGMNKFEKWMT